MQPFETGVDQSPLERQVDPGVRVAVVQSHEPDSVNRSGLSVYSWFWTRKHHEESCREGLGLSY